MATGISTLSSLFTDGTKQMTDTKQPDQETLFEFPCEYPIKIVGKQHDGETKVDFEKEVVAIFEKHFDTLKEGAIEMRHSAKGNYASLTITVMAESKAQLDALYQELTSHHLVVWAL